MSTLTQEELEALGSDPEALERLAAYHERKADLLGGHPGTVHRNRATELREAAAEAKKDPPHFIGGNSMPRWASSKMVWALPVHECKVFADVLRLSFGAFDGVEYPDVEVPADLWIEPPDTTFPSNIPRLVYIVNEHGRASLMPAAEFEEDFTLYARPKGSQ